VTAGLAAVALVAALAGGPAVGEEAMKAEAEGESEAIVEAVFRALLVEAAPEGDEVVCLVVRRVVEGREQIGDPSPELLARLRARHPAMRPGSACSRRRGERASETSTGAEAVVLDVGPVERLDERAARATAGFSRGGWSSSESEYHLVDTGGGWQVERAVRKRTT
jgi:hypothetical protein